MNNNKEEHNKLEKWARVLLVAAGLFIVLSFFAPYIFTQPSLKARLNFNNTGGIADTIGGLMNPFIALAGVIVTGLAFYMQYKANLIQRKQLLNQEYQYKVQQFESHFFEMLKLHKENVNEMEIYLSKDHQYRGRSVFKRGVEEIHRNIESTQPTYFIPDGMNMPTDAIVFPYRFHNAYRIFFWGEKTTPKYMVGGVSISFAITGVLYDSSQNWNAVLGHYYRHLFSMVKFVVDSTVIHEYENKLRYLTILRAQLSNHEQIMLYYNWLSGYGENWEVEIKDDQDNVIKKNEFLTKYRMIHNVWRKEVYQHAYVLNTLNMLDERSRETIGEPLLEEDE